MYQEQYLLYFVIFSFAAYFIVTDESIAKFVFLYSKIVKINIERFIWMVRFHPRVTTNPIFQWWMMRKYNKTIQQIQKEMIKKDD